MLTLVTFIVLLMVAPVLGTVVAGALIAWTRSLK